MTYHTIADPPLPGPLSMLVKTGSNPYYLALLPIGAGNPVASVQVSSPGRGWQAADPDQLRLLAGRRRARARARSQCGSPTRPATRPR